MTVRYEVVHEEKFISRIAFLNLDEEFFLIYGIGKI